MIFIMLCSIDDDIVHNIYAILPKLQICDFDRGMTHAVNSLHNYFCDSYNHYSVCGNL